MLVLKWRAFAFSTLLFFAVVDSKCCNKKVVSGISNKAGTYILVSNSDSVPDFCLGGCVYTKEDDPLPGSNYCFKDGVMNTTCSGGGCGTGEGVIEGWIEKYYDQECSMQINTVLRVNVWRQGPSVSCGSSTNYLVYNVDLALFDNPTCDGSPSQNGTIPNTNFGIFLFKIQNIKPWSILFSKTGFKTKCHSLSIGFPLPFSYNHLYVGIEEDENESIIMSTVTLNYTFVINNELQSDVFVQGNPASCQNFTFPFRFTNPFGKSKIENEKFKQTSRNIKHSKPPSQNDDYDFFARNPEQFRQGSGSGSGNPGGGSNFKCSPTCAYASENTDPSKIPCNCRGVIGGGITLGIASMAGSLYWYNVTSSSSNYIYSLPTFYMAFAEFKRRNNTSIRVCESNLSVFIRSKNYPRTIQKTVPCFDPQIPPTTTMPTYPTYPGGSGSPTLSIGSESSSAADSGSSINADSGSSNSIPGIDYDSGFWPTSYPHWLSTPNYEYEELFSEADGVLIWGNGDRYWILGCMPKDLLDKFITLEVNFFTVKDPKDTPEFCGCLISATVLNGNTEASKEQVKECYVKALSGGPSSRNLFTKQSLLKKNEGKHVNKKSQNEINRLQKKIQKLKGLNRKHKIGRQMKHFKKFQKFDGRSKREILDEELYDESKIAKAIFTESEDAEMETDYEDFFDEYDKNYSLIDDAEYDDYGDSSPSSDW